MGRIMCQSIKNYVSDTLLVDLVSQPISEVLFLIDFCFQLAHDPAPMHF